MSLISSNPCNGIGATHASAGKKAFAPSIFGVTTSEFPAQSEFPSKGWGIEARGRWESFVEAVRLAAGLVGGFKMAVRDGGRAR